MVSLPLGALNGITTNVRMDYVLFTYVSDRCWLPAAM